MYPNVAGQSMVILNSQRVASKLLDQRGANSSSRPWLIVTNEILSGGHFISFQFKPKSLSWRRMRGAVHESFKITSALLYHAMEAEEAARLALDLRSRHAKIPKDRHTFSRFTGSIAGLSMAIRR